MKVTKYLLLFIIIAFLFSGVFPCHTYTVKAFEMVYDYSDSCESKKEISISQNKTQNSQEFIIDFDLKTSKELPDLAPEIDINFTFLENLNNFQTNQLLTIAKIE